MSYHARVVMVVTLTTCAVGGLLAAAVWLSDFGTSWKLILTVPVVVFSGIALGSVLAGPPEDTSHSNGWPIDDPPTRR